MTANKGYVELRIDRFSYGQNRMMFRDEWEGMIADAVEAMRKAGYKCKFSDKDDEICIVVFVLPKAKEPRLVRFWETMFRVGRRA